MCITFSLDQKRALVKATEPILKLLHRGYRRLAQDPQGKEAILGMIRQGGEVEKILLVRLDAIGDLLLSEPAMAALRRRFPKARIDLVASPASARVLLGNPHLDSIIPYQAPWHALWRGKRVNWRKEAALLWAILRRLRRERYSLGIELRGDFRDILFMVAARPKASIGNGGRGGGFLLDWEISFVPASAGIRAGPFPEKAHQVEEALSLAASLGGDPTPRAPKLYINAEDRALAAKLLPQSNNAPLIALHLGAGFPSKCLPLSKFAAVAKQLCSGPNRENRRLVLVGGTEDVPLKEAFLAQMSARGGSGQGIINLVGQLTVLQTAAVLERCHLFIGNDSAPMHLAASVGTPIVTFFGPSEPWKFHPYGSEYRLLEVPLPCRPCDYVHCIHQEYLCMTAQSVEAITEAAEELLATKNIPARIG